ncbi:unnamed protein product [Lactuca saligna]|uniref:Uncharacterized protein n=1 Tax=Lactuca saligna TaxID=75948 RepID=A0AA36EPE6_LACSI|nr:unnamed protein product [Lactuca saligna]
MQMVVITPTPSQPEMSETGRAILQKEIVVTNFLDAKTTTQPIPDTGDQSETNNYVGFIDLGFMPQVVVPAVPLNLNHRKRKASSSRGAHDAKGRSFVIGDPSAPAPSKKSMKGNSLLIWIS